MSTEDMGWRRIKTKPLCMQDIKEYMENITGTGIKEMPEADTDCEYTVTVEFKISRANEIDALAGVEQLITHTDYEIVKVEKVL